MSCAWLYSLDEIRLRDPQYFPVNSPGATLKELSLGGMRSTVQSFGDPENFAPWGNELF